MTREEREQALEWFKNRPITMSGAKKMYDLAFEALSADGDTISRQAAIDEIEERKSANGYRNVAVISELNRLEGYIMRLPSAQPERAGRCVWCDGIEGRRLRIEFYWIDDDGNTASFSEPHIVATGIAKYCPECGRKLKMEVEHD